jgi:transcription elongation factor GreA
MKKQFNLTQQGVDELKGELKELVAQRTEIADRIKTAREFGDLAENAEYSSSRQDQERNEARISEIEHILANVQVITATNKSGKVVLGSVVTLKSADDKTTKHFQVVGTVEANPLEGKISDESPIGRVLIGKKQGEEVEIKTPAETATYTIVDVS